MKDKFAAIDGPTRRATIVIVVLAFLLACSLVVGLTWQASRPTRLTGDIKTVEVIASSRLNGGSRVIASVRLENGYLVTGYVDRGLALSSGEAVVVWKHSRFIGGDIYEISGRVEK
jgi:hypothetical protein